MARTWLADFFRQRGIDIDGSIDLYRTDIFDAGWLDSFGVVELITAIESEYGFEMTADHLDDPRLRTIEGLSEIIQTSVRG